MDIESNDMDNKTWALYVCKHHFYHVLGKIKGYFSEGTSRGFKPVDFGEKRPQKWVNIISLFWLTNLCRLFQKPS